MTNSCADLANARTIALPPATLVIFGATGDLAARLLTPALITLYRGGYLDDRFKIIGIGHEQGDGGMLRDKLVSTAEQNPATVAV